MAFALEHPVHQAEAAIVVTLPELRVVKERYGLVPVGLVLVVPQRVAMPELASSDS